MLDKANQTAVNNLWEFFTTLTPTSKLPRPALDKAVCDRLFAARIRSVGRATLAWFRKVIDTNSYDIDWTMGGCYNIVRRAPKVMLVHISGDEVAFVPTFLGVSGQSRAM